MLRRLTAAAAAATCLLAPAAPALGSGDDVIKDCVHNGRLTKKYSQKEYSDALSRIPTDVDEYTDCRDIIRHAQLGLGGGGGGSGGTGTGAAQTDPFAGATPQEVAAARRAIARARGAGGAPRHLGADVVTPGALAFHKLDAVSELPTPLVVLAVLIGLAALAAGAHLVRSRVSAGDPGA